MVRFANLVDSMLKTNFVNDVWLTRIWRLNSWWLLMMFDWPDAGGWTISKIAYAVRLVDSKLKTKYSQWCFCWPDPGGWTVDKRQWCLIDPMLEVEQLEALLQYIYIQVYTEVICCLVKYVAVWWNMMPGEICCPLVKDTRCLLTVVLCYTF